MLDGDVDDGGCSEGSMSRRCSGSVDGGCGAGGFRVRVRRFLSRMGPSPFPPPLPLPPPLPPLPDGTTIVVG